MAFHEGFITNQMDILHSPNWFTKRAELYKEVAAWVNKPFDEVFFDFSTPDCGWIDVSIYVNSKKRHQFPLIDTINCLPQIRTWLEDIVIDTKLSSDLYLELEGRVVIFHYEHIRLAEVGVRRKFVNKDRDKDEWESFDANINEPDTGLFYLYDSGCEDIPIVCYCKTKQFIFALYNSLIYYSSKGKYTHLIGNEWLNKHYDNNSYSIDSRWKFYNSIKSALIEWNYDSNKGFRHYRPKFKETPFIKETVHMWAEWGGALFWHQHGGCCGNADSFFVDTDHTVVNLKDLPAIREWYNEFDNRNPLEKWSDTKFTSWFNRGWELAKQIRERLPETVDLFYHWKSFDIENEYFTINIPILVPDNRLLIKR